MPPTPRPGQRRLSGTVLRAASGVLAGVLCVVAMFLPFRASGMGSTEPAYRLGQLVASGLFDPLVPAWIGVVILLVPLIGAVLIATSMIDSRWARAVQIGASILALLIVLTVTIALGMAQGLSLGAAPVVLAIGCALVIVATVLGRRSRRG